MGISQVTKVYFWGGMAAKYAMACFAANENDDENDNFHPVGNCQSLCKRAQVSLLTIAQRVQPN